MSPIPIPSPNKTRRLSSELSGSLVHSGSRGTVVIPSPMPNNLDLEIDIDEAEVAEYEDEFNGHHQDQNQNQQDQETTPLLSTNRNNKLNDISLNSSPTIAATSGDNTRVDDVNDEHDNYASNDATTADHTHNYTNFADETIGRDNAADPVNDYSEVTTNTKNRSNSTSNYGDNNNKDSSIYGTFRDSSTQEDSGSFLDDGFPLEDYTSTSDEIKVLCQSAFPLVITFLLQNSLSVASIFSVGHLGKKELAAVTLGSMTANITGYAAVQGLSTCLDTLCCQAYGAKRYHLVGVYFQRCCALILTIFVPICLFWFFGAEAALKYILPKSELGPGNEDLPKLAADYLKVVSVGMPGYILFECGKRFLQSQGVFHASTYILLGCAPINALLNYLLVWNETVGIGYLGAPLSVTIVDWLMAVGLFVYTITTKHPANVLSCWGGLNISLAFKHWNRMLHLALNGLIMVWAEFLAFEVLTIYSSYLGLIALDANSVVSSITALTYQIPFAVSIAGSTRLANYIGASLPQCASKCAKITLLLGAVVAFFNCSMVFLFKVPIAKMFTSDEEVILRIAGLLKIISVIQIFDAFNAVTAGLLRGEGMQHVGSITNMFAYYVVGLPFAYFLTFKLNCGLEGLWIGTGTGLVCISAIQTFFSLCAVNWDDIIYQAQKRNERERIL